MAAGGGELVAGETELGAGWCPSEAAGSRAGAAGVAMVVMSEDRSTKVNFKKSTIYLYKKKKEKKKVNLRTAALREGKCALKKKKKKKKG